MIHFQKNPLTNPEKDYGLLTLIQLRKLYIFLILYNFIMIFWDKDLGSKSFRRIILQQP